MEGQPKRTVAIERENNVENLADWRALKERAPQAAERRIASITGFAEMEVGAQVVSLQALQNELAEDNSNRFVGQVVAEKIAERMDDMSDAGRLHYRLPLRTPAERTSEKTTPFPKSPMNEEYTKYLDYTHAANDPNAPKVDEEQLPRAA